MDPVAARPAPALADAADAPAAATDAEVAHAIATAHAVGAAVASTVRGKDDVVRLALVALLAGGHLLVEDLPGTGKTLLAKAMATAIGGTFGRVQCTPDLLPTDITGTSVYSPVDSTWEFRPGPLFANVVLVDEVNRASPRTQAALLEPMEEHQVTVDGRTHPLPAPFFCIATQNPHGQIGTFPLPESQLDRFSLVLSMGLPGRAAEREILTGQGGLDAYAAMRPATDPVELGRAMAAVHRIWCAPALVDYLLDVVDRTRSHPQIEVGASPRASVGLLQAARAHAVVSGRTHVLPDDVQAVAPAALAHRISLGGTVDARAGREVVAGILQQVPVPRP